MAVFDSALANLAQVFIDGLPNVVYAVLTLVIGYILGSVIGSVIEKIVIRSKVDNHLKEKEQIAFKMSSVLGTISKWIIYLVFLQQASVQLGVLAISSVIDEIVLFIPGVVGSVLVIIASYAIAIYVKEQIIGSKGLYTNIIGKMIFFFIVYVGIATALPLMRINADLINNILLIIMGSIGIGVAIALGFGLKDTIAELAKVYVKKTGKAK